MTDFTTVFTDDDGDGVYDDIHVVNPINDNGHYHSAPDDSWGRDNYPRKKSSPSIIPWNKKIKWGLIIFGVLAIGGILSKIAFAILFLFLS